MMNDPPWSEVAAACSLTDSVLPTPKVLPFEESTPVYVLVEPLPLQLVVEYSVAVSVNVTPLGAAKTLTLPSRKVVLARGVAERLPSQGEA